MTVMMDGSLSRSRTHHAVQSVHHRCARNALRTLNTLAAGRSGSQAYVRRRKMLSGTVPTRNGKPSVVARRDPLRPPLVDGGSPFPHVGHRLRLHVLRPRCPSLLIT